MKNDKQVEYITCSKCGTTYKKGKKHCPKCYCDEQGVYHGYVPMDEKKMKKVRIIVGVVLTLIAVAVILVVKLT